MKIAAFITEPAVSGRILAHLAPLPRARGGRSRCNRAGLEKCGGVRVLESGGVCLKFRPGCGTTVRNGRHLKQECQREPDISVSSRYSAAMTTFGPR